METVNELFVSMERYQNKTAVISSDESISYKQLIDRSCRLASGLKKVLNPGDKMGVWLPNSIDWIIVELAAGLIGATVVTLNMRYKSHEISHILQDSECKMFIFQPELDSYDYTTVVDKLFYQSECKFPYLEYIVATKDIFTSMKTQSTSLINFYSNSNVNFAEFKEESINGHEIYNMLYTSGTTGAPKGVMLSQKTVLKHSYNAAKYLRMNAEDVVLGALPFCGIFGFNTLFASLTTGACIVPVERYKPMEALRLIAEYKCTVFNGVDGMTTPMFDAADIKYDLSSLRIGAYAIFSSNNRLFIDSMEKVFPNMTIVQTYGMTEVGSLVFVGDPSASVEERSRAGGFRVSQEIEIEVIDKGSGMLLKNGEEGEIVIGGYNVMSGYYKNPEKTTESFTDDGKFKTGDLGMKLDDGSIIYKGRLREALRLKGFLVSPKEIEDYICLLSGIEIVQIVHVDFNNEERLVAFIKEKQGHELTETRVLDYCKEGLADFKCPQNVFFVNEFPTTAGSNGEKIQKLKLKKIAVEQLGKINHA